MDGARLVRYPGSTLTAVLLNLRPGHPEFSPAAVRTSLMAALNRERLIQESFAGMAAPATGPIPPVSPMFDPAADPAVPYSRGAAGPGLRRRPGRRTLRVAAAQRKQPLSIEVLSPTEASNPGLYEAAEAVVRDWTAIGLTAKHVALPRRVRRGAAVDRTFQVAVADLRIGLDPDLYRCWPRARR